jgi:hypothetical protein
MVGCHHFEELRREVEERRRHDPAVGRSCGKLRERERVFKGRRSEEIEFREKGNTVAAPLNGARP